MVMKSVGIADLKAHLSKHLRSVRRGHPITVLDRATPVAVIVPHRQDGPALASRAAIRQLTAVELPPALGDDLDSLRALREERAGR